MTRNIKLERVAGALPLAVALCISEWRQLRVEFTTARRRQAHAIHRSGRWGRVPRHAFSSLSVYLSLILIRVAICLAAPRMLDFHLNRVVVFVSAE